MWCADICGALENHDTAIDGFLHPDVVFHEHPNRLKPQGDRADAVQMREARERGRNAVSRQSYEILGALTDGDSVAARVVWRGVLKVGYGALKAGDEMTCDSGMFFTLKDGRIFEQHNYDCFPPF